MRARMGVRPALLVRALRKKKVTPNRFLSIVLNVESVRNTLRSKGLESLEQTNAYQRIITCCVVHLHRSDPCTTIWHTEGMLQDALHGCLLKTDKERIMLLTSLFCFNIRSSANKKRGLKRPLRAENGTLT